MTPTLEFLAIAVRCIVVETLPLFKNEHLSLDILQTTVHHLQQCITSHNVLFIKKDLC